jgi:hypothetical protein
MKNEFIWFFSLMNKYEEILCELLYLVVQDGILQFNLCHISGDYYLTPLLTKGPETVRYLPSDLFLNAEPAYKI